MKPLSFGLWHTSLVLALLLFPQAILIKQKSIIFTLSESVGLVLLETSFVIALELLAMSFSSLLKGKAQRFIQSALAALLIPLSFIILIDYKFIDSLGNHPTSDIISFGTSRSLSDIPFIISNYSSEITIGLVATLLFSILASIYLAYSVWYSNNTRKHIAQSSFLIFASIVFLIMASTTTCDLIQSRLLKQTQILKTPIPLLTKLNPSPLCKEVHAKQQEISDNRFNTKNKQIDKLNYLQNSPILSLELTKKSQKKNIVIISLESFRVDQLTVYNPELQTTPFLAQIAKQGITIETAYADMPSSSKSLVSVYCGIPPNVRNQISESYPNGIKQPCLPKLLKPLGYTSGLFQTHTQTFQNRGGLAHNLGFDNLTALEDIDRKGWQKVDPFGIEERAMLKPIMQWVDTQQSPFLLSVFTLTGHLSKNRLPSNFETISMSEDKRMNNYYNTIRYIDTFLSELFSEFEQRQLLGNTIFIFTGDHGNHYGTGRHWSEPMQTTLKVPMVIWDQSLTSKPQTITGLRMQTDIMPTIIDLLDIKLTSGQTYGTSLLKPTPNKKIHFTCKYNSCLGLIEDGYKFIYRYDNTAVELYDINNDLTNQNNLIEQLSEEKIQQYITELEDWKKSVEALY